MRIDSKSPFQIELRVERAKKIALYSHCWRSLVSPVCEMDENGSCAAIIDADTYGEADAEEPGRPSPTAPPSGPPANPENRGGKSISCSEGNSSHAYLTGCATENGGKLSNSGFDSLTWSAWLLLSFCPFPERHPARSLCSTI